jgi:ATP-dependent DNA helicase RecG
VVLQLATVAADEVFLQLVVDQEDRGGAELPIDSLIALAALREHKRLSADELAHHIHRDPAQ